MVGHIAKPIDPEQLLLLLQQILAERLLGESPRGKLNLSD